MNEIDFSKEEMYYGGSQNRPPKVTFLQAGPFSCQYESGNIRYLKAGGKEMIRMIYPALRDHNWGTIFPLISNEQIEKSENHFLISYDCLYEDNEIRFQARYHIKGDAKGNFIFTLDGEAKSTFRKNRIGFNVLHPPEVAGEKYIVRHTDGSQEEGHFPEIISPHQPIMDIKALGWDAGGAWMELEFEGDLFEMEDQRNWTDASFKTYSTPLSRPFPVVIKEGATIHQQVKLKLGNPCNQPVLAQEGLIVNVGHEKYPLPAIGIGQSSEFTHLTQQDADLLKLPNFSHYRVDLKLNEDDLEKKWKRAVKESAQLNLALELALHFSSNHARELEKLKELLTLYQTSLKKLLIFSQDHKSTPESLISQVMPELRILFQGVPIGGGTDCFFTELNRYPVKHPDLDFLSYSINPQVHHFDNQSLVETLKAQTYTIESARSFAQGRPIHISPITLRMRFNPNATGPEPLTPSNELPPQVDTRQMSLFGAAWTMGSIKYLSEHEVPSLTYFETIGRRGILQGAHEPLGPSAFRSKKGMLFPVFWIFYQLLTGEKVEILKSESSQPLKLDVMAWETAGEKWMMLANFEPIEKQVRINGWKPSFDVLTMDEDNFKAFTSDLEFMQKANWKQLSNEIRLKPHGLAILK